MEALKAREEILSLIKIVSEEHNLHNYNIIDVKTNQKGEGYLGEIFMVTVEDAKNGKQFEMVIKAAFVDKKIRDMVPIRMSFQNEITFYNDLKPAYEQLEKDHGITKSIEFAPKCLKVSSKDEAEILVLENLKAASFEIFSKKSILDEDHVKLIFQYYGRVHGYSYVLRDQKPEEYARITATFHNVYEEFTKNEYFINYLRDVSKMVQDMFIPGQDDEILKNYQKYATKTVGDIFTDVVTEKVDHEAILHGDCWSNNMMFKYEKSANCKRPIEMRLIDWQLVKVGSPVCDLSYCLYSGASKKAFDNLDKYLKIYHDSFSSFVRQLGSDPEKLFPFEVLKDHWKKYSRFGLIMTLQVLRMKLTCQEDLVDLTDDLNMADFADVLSKQKYDKEGYETRMKDLVRHMSEVDAL